jgi:periplasmic protein CpxP/Spy
MMDALRKKNLLLWAVILLIIANVVMLAAFFMTRMHKAPHAEGASPAMFIEKELGFDTAQKERFKELHKQHHQETEDIRRKINEEEDSLFALIQSPSDSTKELIIRELASNKSQIDRLTFEHFRKLREMCNPEQQKKFDNIIHDVIRMIAPPPPGRPAGVPGAPPPPPGRPHGLPGAPLPPPPPPGQ